MTHKIYAQRRSCPVCRAVFLQDHKHCPTDGALLKVLPEDPLIGVMLANRYHVDAVCADGGMSRVYRASTPEGSEVAIKLPWGELVAKKSSQERFAREAELATRIVHPNVLLATDSGHTEFGLPFLVMPFVHGHRLSTIIDENAPLGAATAIGLCSQILGGLHAVHEAGVLHRDLKASNVLVTPEGIVRIFDFGAAIRASDQTGARLTRRDKVVGSPSYMAPERFTSDYIDLRADLFSVGVIMYRMLARVFPYDGPPVMRAIQRVTTTQTPPTFRERAPTIMVDPGLESVVLRLLSRDPDARYASAKDAQAALDSLELT